MRICIVGTGYVGLVSAACFAEMGNTVVCVDKNVSVVESLNQGKIHIYEPGLEDLVMRNQKEKRLIFTTSLSEGLEKAHAIFICVGTPSQADGACDLSFVRDVAKEIGATIKSELLVVDKSTVPVGTADMVTSLIQEEQDKRGVSIRFEVVSNPEFLKEGTAVADFLGPDRVIIGTSNDWARSLLKELYSPFAVIRDKLIFMDVRSAEMTKYAANCMLATKISFINEIANICENIGADVRDVRKGIGADKRIGYHFIYPGLGYGGSCFPKDVKALINTASSVGVTPKLLQAVEDVNRNQKQVMAKRILEYFSQQGGVKGKKLALWGLAFKANTDDLRESAAIEIITILTNAGMSVCAYDPEAGKNAKKYFEGNTLVKIVDEQYTCLEDASALLVATEWNQFRAPDIQKVKRLLVAPVLFDGRNIYNGEEFAKNGFAYFCIGRK